MWSPRHVYAWRQAGRAVILLRTVSATSYRSPGPREPASAGVDAAPPAYELIQGFGIRLVRHRVAHGATPTIMISLEDCIGLCGLEADDNLWPDAAVETGMGQRTKPLAR